MVARAHRSVGHRTTVAPATGRPHMSLMVHVSGAGNVWPVYRAVPYPVSSYFVQTVTRPGSPGRPSQPVEASIPMEVDPAVWLSPSGAIDLVSRLTYAQVVDGVWATGQLPSPLQGQAGIKGALGDEALSSGRPLERSIACTEAAMVLSFILVLGLFA